MKIILLILAAISIFWGVGLLFTSAHREHAEQSVDKQPGRLTLQGEWFDADWIRICVIKDAETGKSYMIARSSSGLDIEELK
jgi:hypothetical protein